MREMTKDRFARPAHVTFSHEKHYLYKKSGRLSACIFGRRIEGLFYFGPMPAHVLVDFVFLPPGHGNDVSATDF